MRMSRNGLGLTSNQSVGADMCGDSIKINWQKHGLKSKVRDKNWLRLNRTQEIRWSMPIHSTQFFFNNLYKQHFCTPKENQEYKTKNTKNIVY
jgi:hypothetical protein